MRILVTGGRDYPDRAKVWAALDAHRAMRLTLTIIQGGATGADEHAREWVAREGAVGRRAHLINEPAAWGDIDRPGAVIRRRRDGTPYDAAAGGIRNQIMLDQHKPDLVLAFPGSTGTADMIRRARKAGVPVIEVL